MCAKPIPLKHKTRQHNAVRSLGDESEGLSPSGVDPHPLGASPSPLPTPMSALEEANRYIFVQDWKAAAERLDMALTQWPDNPELLVRRVEVASSQGLESLENWIHQQAPPTEVGEGASLRTLGLLFARIRAMELQEGSAPMGEALEEGPLTPPSRLLSAKPLEWDGTPLTPPSSRSACMVNNRLQILRQPAWPDDTPLPEPPHLPQVLGDDEARFPSSPLKTHAGAPLPPAIASLLSDAQKLSQQAGDTNWLGLFVLGCAHELANQMSEATEKWLQAWSLAPRSMAILSVLSELQQLGLLPEGTSARDGGGKAGATFQFTEAFEALDPYVVHGHLETHNRLYKEFMARGEHLNAIAALRTMADWMQRSRGEVPVELEVLCLLGAHRAYIAMENPPAAEACYREAEMLVIATRKSGHSVQAMHICGGICEDFGFSALARMCHFGILTSMDAPEDLLLQTATHCATNHATPALFEILQGVYRKTNGHPEVRFCQLICALNLKSIPIRPYLERKKKIRAAVAESDFDALEGLLEESLMDTDSDAEIHYYKAELLVRRGRPHEAEASYADMYALDPLNPESLVRYSWHLLRQSQHERAAAKSREALGLKGLSAAQTAELNWILAGALFHNNQFEESRLALEKVISIDPWNPSYLQLALVLWLPGDHDSFAQTVGFDPSDALHEDMDGSEQQSRWHKGVQLALEKGHSEYAWLMAKYHFVKKGCDTPSLDLVCRTGAGYHPRIAAQQLLMLLNREESPQPFSRVAVAIARVYCTAGEWALVDEWLEIASRSGADGQHLQGELFEMEAVRIAMSGRDFKRAQSLIEAALDLQTGEKSSLYENGCLHGYLLVSQGQIRAGLEKLQKFVAEGHTSIQGLYFAVKGFERAGCLQGERHAPGKEALNRLFSSTPTNMLERRLIEEIYCTVGHKGPLPLVHLAC